ncbi:hypothetical protein CMUS01_14615, partial [Colletotrichum musicola]
MAFTNLTLSLALSLILKLPHLQLHRVIHSEHLKIQPFSRGILRNRRASVTENMTSTFRSLHIGNPCGSGAAHAANAGLEGCERDIVYTRFSDIPAREVVSCADVWERLV